MFSVVIDYFKDRGGKVYMYVAGLDVANTLDSVNHYGIFIKLINMYIPFFVLNSCVNWYVKLSGCVRWVCILSQRFSMRSGVMEGSMISSLLFSLYIKDFIIVLRSQGYGCYLGDMFVDCLLFANDILLLSAFV